MKRICLYTLFLYFMNSLHSLYRLRSSTHVDNFYRLMWLYSLELFSGANVL